MKVFEAKIDIKNNDGLTKFLKDCEEATKQGLIDGTSELHLYIGDEKVVYSARLKGVWIGIDQYPHEEWECSNCGNIINTYIQDELEEHKYCHKCGAEMSTPWAEMRGEE